MEDGQEKVEFLRKILVQMEAGTARDCMDLTVEPIGFEFIYGIGTDGLSPFEVELSHKREGDEVLIPVSREGIPTTFQHLSIPPINIPGTTATLFLKVRIVKVTPADQREVIKAMANIAECGSHCCGH